MQTENEPRTIDENGWICRYQPQEHRDASRCLLIVHGWTGDEKVMWVFTRKLAEHFWIFAPRGLISAPGGGYGWVSREQNPAEDAWPSLDDFRPSAQALIKEFEHWQAMTGAPTGPFDVMGFSQGAAMAYALAAFFPEQIDRVVALAGFLPVEPDGIGRYHHLRGKKIYIAHGKQDDIVPIRQAERAIHILQEAGAEITYCESDSSHKLALSCLRGLETFVLSGE